jgi:hypothetical protein
MAGLVPLQNAVVETSIDFNNKRVSNNAGFHRYNVLASADTYYTATASDFNSVIVFSGNVTVEINTGATGSLNYGAELILISNTGRVKVLDSDTRFSQGPTKAIKLIYTGPGMTGKPYKFLYTGAVASVYTISYTDCCNSSANVYQLLRSNAVGFEYDKLIYKDTECTILFNGTMTNGGSWYSVVSGVAGPGSFCVPNDYTSVYSYFYTNPALSDPYPISLSSVGGLSSGNSPSAFTGNKFFDAPLTALDCFNTGAVTATYYYSKSGGDGSVYLCNFAAGYLLSWSQVL